MRLPSEKPACPSRRAPSAVRTESGRRQPERGGKGCWDAEHPDRDWPSGGTASRASPTALATRDDTARVVRERGSRTLRVAKRWRVATGSPPGVGGVRAAGRHADVLCGGSSARGAGQHQPGVDARAGFPDAASPSHCHAIDTARAADTGGSGECWPHTPHADFHRLLGVAHGGAASGKPGSTASHRAGGQSLVSRCGQRSCASPPEGEHSPRRVPRAE